MSQKEKVFLTGILTAVFLLVSVDIFGDSKEGVDLWHVALEGGVGLLSLIGIFYILSDSFKKNKDLIDVKNRLIDIEKESEKWRQESKKYVEGLSHAIDEQLSKWGLSVAEKEVAFLLLKGLSLKEIANIRNTSEKTSRVQSMAIYSKSGLSSRSELSAYFLEDLLVPQKNILSDVENS